MTEEILNNSKSIALVGGYRVIQNPDGFRLEKLKSVSGNLPSADAFIFASREEAEGIAHVLSRAFQKGYSQGTSTFRIENLAVAEVSGGDNGLCKLYRLNTQNGKIEEEPFLVAKSRQELEEGLRLFLDRKDGN